MADRTVESEVLAGLGGSSLHHVMGLDGAGAVAMFFGKTRRGLLRTCFDILRAQGQVNKLTAGQEWFDALQGWRRFANSAGGGAVLLFVPRALAVASPSRHEWIEEDVSTAISTGITSCRLASLLAERDRCFTDRITRVRFWNLNGELCGLIGLGSRQNGTLLTLPASYVVSEALRGYWGKLSLDGTVIPLASSPSALISSSGQRLFGPDFVGMWSKPVSGESLFCDGAALFASVMVPEVTESAAVLLDLDGIGTPPTPPMRD